MDEWSPLIKTMVVQGVYFLLVFFLFNAFPFFFSRGDGTHETNMHSLCKWSQIVYTNLYKDEV